MINRHQWYNFITKRRKCTADLTLNERSQKLHIYPVIIQTLLSLIELWPFSKIFRKERQGLLASKIAIQKNEFTVSFNIRPRIEKFFKSDKIHIYYLEYVWICVYIKYQTTPVFCSKQFLWHQHFSDFQIRPKVINTTHFLVGLWKRRCVCSYRPQNEINMF